MEDALKEISARLEKIEERLGIMHGDCSKMSQHIDSVEKVIAKFKLPLAGYFFKPKEIKG